MSDWTIDTAIEAAKKDPASYGRQVYELSNKRIALSNRVMELEARLAEVAHAYDVTFKRRTELELAILPFAEFATNVDENGWTSTIHREPISTWFGPSDFREAGKLKA